MQSVTAYQPIPLNELRQKGFEALVKELGASNALRFLSLYEPGHGDYTKERHAWLGTLTIDQITDDIYRLRAEGKL